MADLWKAFLAALREVKYEPSRGPSGALTDMVAEWNKDPEPDATDLEDTSGGAPTTLPVGAPDTSGGSTLDTSGGAPSILPGEAPNTSGGAISSSLVLPGGAPNTSGGPPQKYRQTPPKVPADPPGSTG